jgi:hypothetical protein
MEERMWFGLEYVKKSFICRTEEQNHAFEKEARVMAHLNNPNVLEFICCHQDSNEQAKL